MAVIFAVELGSPDDPTPRRWTCRDISPSQFYHYGKRIAECLDLKMWAISQAFYLINPSLDKMVMSEWVHRFLLKGQDAQADHGVILLNDSVCSHNTAFLDNFDSREVLIIAQIIFPDQGYHGTW